MNILICLVIIAILTIIKGIARSEVTVPITNTETKTINLEQIENSPVISDVIQEYRDIENEIKILGEDIMNIINEE